MTVEERVAQGAALLDQKMPGWETKIDLDRLDIASTTDCICGQLYDLHNWPVDTLYQWGFGSDWRKHFGAAMAEDFRALTAEWKRVITERRMLVR